MPFKVEGNNCVFSKEEPIYHEFLAEVFGSDFDDNIRDEKYSIEYLIQPFISGRMRHVMNNDVAYYAPCEDLLSFLNDKLEGRKARAEKCRVEGLYSFELLDLIFEKGTLVMIKNSSFPLAGEVSKMELVADLMGTYWSVYVDHYVTNGGALITYKRRYYIESYNGVKPLDEVGNLAVVTEDDKRMLLERFDRFKKYISFSPQYVQYKGKSWQRSYYNMRYFSENGRIMIDCQAFCRFNANYPFGFQWNSTHNKDNAFANDTMTDRIKICFYSIGWGYSMTNKEWVEFNLENCSPIEFDKEAYDLLVMDETKKEMTKALLLNHEKAFQDIIKGKSGGCIFLLHGPPGTGKTLTCEAVSDLMERPLYVVSVAELGVTSVDLENNLKKILEMANSWNATLLFDEADIFMERRSVDNVQRNAMVSIFLRLLEKNSGVIFLTTNRADTIDEAFRSRITVSFEYHKLNYHARQQIWKNLFKYSQIDCSNVDIEKISEWDVNGRQIKNLIRMSQTLAISRSVPLEMKILETCLQYI